MVLASAMRPDMAQPTCLKYKIKRVICEQFVLVNFKDLLDRGRND